MFLALGLGLALPFLLLTLAPQLIGRLPRPGAWMETLKQLLAFPVYATVAWLIWVLGQQVGPAGLFAALIGLVLVALAAWSFSIWQTSGTWGRRVAVGVAVASARRRPPSPSPACSATASTRRRPRRPRPRPASSPSPSAASTSCAPTNRPVFVNMTAAWCITCLVNEHVALVDATP